MKLLYDTALSFLNTPSIWGGYSFLGYDCSGLVQEILKSAGVDPPGDQTAQALFDHFRDTKNHISNMRDFGALVFYGHFDSQIDHVALMMSPFRMIEAGGSSKDIVTPGQAAKAGAFVRIRPFRQQKLQGVFMPEYPYCVI